MVMCISSANSHTKSGLATPAGSCSAHDCPFRLCSASRKRGGGLLDRVLVDPGELVDLLDDLPERRPEPLRDLAGLLDAELRLDDAVGELEHLELLGVDVCRLL